jgi:hypothetical protein
VNTIKIHSFYTMVGVEIPGMPEAQPLTTHSINHEATMDLDSTNAFEGIPLVSTFVAMDASANGTPRP